MAEEFDPTQMSEQELLALPESNIPANKLDAFLSRRAEILQTQEFKAGLELSAGNSGSRAATREETREAEDKERALQRYLSNLQDLRDREEELIDRIEVQHRETLRRLQDIDDRAIKLHDGRRAYVDGAEFRDKDGLLLRGADKEEAERLRTETSSKWAKQYQAERVRELQVDALRNARKEGHKLDEAMNDAADMTEGARANSLKQGKSVVERLEKQTADMSQVFNNDYASVSGTADSRRTTSYAAKLDCRKDGPAIAPDFSDAATGRSTPPEQKRPESARTSPAPSPSGP